MAPRLIAVKSHRFPIPPAVLVVVSLILATGGMTSGRDRAAQAQAQPQQEADSLAALLQNNSFREARKKADAILLRRPTDPELKAVCGLAILKMGRIAEAETVFHDVLSRSPDNAEAHLGLGRIGRIRNNPETAIAHLRRAVRSDLFYEEALYQSWRAAMEQGIVADLDEIYTQAKERFGRKEKPIPDWIGNGRSVLLEFPVKKLYAMEGRFERISLPLVQVSNGPGRMIRLRLNDKEEYPFHIDSAAPDFLTVSPLLAKDLGLREIGSSTALGVGSGASAAVRFTMLDSVEAGSVTFRNVPVMVSDLYTFRGEKIGLIGTGLLKRFNCTIDAPAGKMDLFPLDRPDMLEANIARTAVAAEVPLYLFDATMVEASVDGAPQGLFILDSAAATHLVDSAYFLEFIKPAIEPDQITPSGIQGALGPQKVNRISDLSIKLGSSTFSHQVAHEFSFAAMSAITGRYAAGLLGNPILWPYRVHFNFRAGKLILEKPPQSSGAQRSPK